MEKRSCCCVCVSQGKLELAEQRVLPVELAEGSYPSETCVIRTRRIVLQHFENATEKAAD